MITKIDSRVSASERFKLPSVLKDGEYIVRIISLESENSNGREMYKIECECLRPKKAIGLPLMISLPAQMANTFDYALWRAFLVGCGIQEEIDISDAVGVFEKCKSCLLRAELTLEQRKICGQIIDYNTIHCFGDPLTAKEAKRLGL